MENKINIAELLKDCPQGMELDCTTWENVTFEKVIGNTIYIKRNSKAPSFDKTVILNQYGCCTGHQDEKCRIFPKGKTNWEGFQRPFKDGDILATTDGKFIAIIKKNGGKYYVCYHTNGTYFEIDGSDWFDRFATEKEKAKLFQAIKANGYRWNPDTKTLEKLVEPIFKVSDKIREKGDEAAAFTISDIDDSCYYCGEYVICNICDQDFFELVPNKFDITTLKPFDKVLVRDGAGFWRPNLFGKDMIVGYRYFTANGSYKECIPYEGNEHLLGTRNDCDEFYKIWEK